MKGINLVLFLNKRLNIFRVVLMNDINAIFEQLKPLSLFELNRLVSAISIILDDPVKNEAIKRHLKIGMKITYFSSDKNDLVEATVTDIRKTWVSVVNTQDNKGWNIKFCSINLQGIDVSINPKKLSDGLDRNSLKVGDQGLRIWTHPFLQVVSQ